MPLECSHSFRNFILWVGSKSTTLNDFWKPLWCTDTQAYTFTQQSLKFFRFLCRPIQSPQHLEGKKNNLNPPHQHHHFSLMPFYTNISPFLQLELTTVHRGHQHHQLCFIQLPNHRLSGNRIHGMGALSCAATSHQGSWNGPMQPWGGVEQYIQHGSSSLEFIYTLYQTWY